MPHPIEIQNLRLRYPETGRVVLHGIDMVVRQGEVKLLLGPSGSGKSSLALTLNGLIPHQMEGEIRGVVLINGVDTTTTQVAALTTQVGLLFQDPDAQIATLTVADEVAFGMENLRVPPAEMPARIDTALARVDMAGMNGRGTDALSGGQKQRLSLASTLAMGAAILVFDEPTANLDPAGTTSFFDLLSRLKAEGATILIIEHKLDDLIARVDSVAVLGLDGKIAADGPPTQVLQEQRELLHELGVWVPQVTELANALTTCDVTLNPYPLTIEDAVAAIKNGPWLWNNRVSQATQPDHTGGESGADGIPALQIEDLTYRYPSGTLALNDASLSIRSGDFYAILGPNGSGKTTLARHLIGLIRPQNGTIRIEGEDIKRLKATEINRRVGYVFQNPEHQFVTLNVYDEVAFSLRAAKLPEAEVQRRVEALLKEFGLLDHRNVNPFKLSQGQKRRLSVATMLALEPKMLILDEPTFGQDLRNATRIMEGLQRLNERGITIIIITHDMKLVAEYARRVGVLINGTVAFEGDVRSLYRDEALLAAAHLEVPPLYAVSQRLREEQPNFPLLMTVRDYTEELCAHSDMSQGAAFSTA